MQGCGADVFDVYCLLKHALLPQPLGFGNDAVAPVCCAIGLALSSLRFKSCQRSVGGLSAGDTLLRRSAYSSCTQGSAVPAAAAGSPREADRPLASKHTLTRAKVRTAAIASAAAALITCSPPTVLRAELLCTWAQG